MRTLRLIFFTLLLLLFGVTVCFGQTVAGQTQELALRQRIVELSDIAGQIKKVDDPTVRIFLQLRLARVLWSDGGDNFANQAQSLTTGALDQLSAQEESVPNLYADLFRRDLIALLEVHASDLATRYRQNPGSNGVDIAYSTLTLEGQKGLAVELLSKELANGLVVDSRITFFLHRLEQEKTGELRRALSDLMSAEERRVGTIPVEILFWLVDFYLKPNNQVDLKQRFLRVALLATAETSTMSDSNQLNCAYGLLQAILPQVKSMAPSLYPQASAQLSSLMARRAGTKSEREKIAERIDASDDPLSQTISEARSASDPDLKDELFLEAAQLALEKGKLQVTFDLATSLTADTRRRKWQEQLLGQLGDLALEKKNPDLAAAAGSRIESPLARVAALQKLSLFFLDLKDSWKARDLLTDSLKVINSVEDKTEKTLALLNTLSLSLKIDDGVGLNVAEQIIKSINSIPTPDSKTDKTIASAYVKKTLMPVAWRTLPVFELLTQRGETTTLGLADRIQLRDIRTSALLGIAIGRMSIAKRNIAFAGKGGPDAH